MKKFTEDGIASGVVLIVIVIVASLLVGAFKFVGGIFGGIFDNPTTYRERFNAQHVGREPDEEKSTCETILNNSRSSFRLHDLGITFEEFKQEYNKRSTLYILDSNTTIGIDSLGAFCSLNCTGIVMAYPISIIDEVYVLGNYEKGSPIQNFITQCEQRRIFNAVAEVFISRMQSAGISENEIVKFKQAIAKCNDLEIDESQGATHTTFLVIDNTGVSVWKWVSK